MHGLLPFARQNVSRKMNGEGLPGDGFRTVSAVLGSFSDRPRSGAASSGLIFTR